METITEIEQLKQEIERLNKLIPKPKHVCEHPDCITKTEKEFCMKHKPICSEPGCGRSCYQDKCYQHSDKAKQYSRDKAKKYREKKRQEKLLAGPNESCRARRGRLCATCRQGATV